MRPDPPRFRWSEAGTRFLVYPQDRVVPGFEMPRIARVTPRPGAIKAGPEDTRIRVVDAIRKKPYRDPVTAEYLWRPPYPKGMPREPRVRPGPRGEFDYVKPGTREFSAATAYASVRCVLEIWEHYLGRRISLVGKGQRKLEIVPRVAAIGDNAWSGEWYIELGFAGRNPRQPYCENLDVIAHEMGHIILKHVIGPTPTGRLEFERRAHDEAGADLVSLVTILHFDRVVDAVLAQTKGKLFSKNIVSRIGEYRADGTGRRRAGRFFFQNQTMRKVASARRSGNKYVYARPLLGAAFDILVEIYEARLARRGLIGRDLAKRSTRATARGHPVIRREFAAAFKANPDGFADALRGATADFARLLATAWRMARRTGVTFSRIASNIIAADARLNRGRYASTIRRAFTRRGIAMRGSRA